MLRHIWHRILRWYHGTPQAPYIGRTRTAAFFALQDNKRHWSSRLIHTIVTFYLREWRWIWTTIIALCALFIAFKKLQ